MEDSLVRLGQVMLVYVRVRLGQVSLGIQVKFKRTVFKGTKIWSKERYSIKQPNPDKT